MRHGGCPVMDLGMPTLIELPELEDCARLCRELGLQFVELNTNLPQYQTERIRAGDFREIAERYGIYFTLHLDENLNPGDFNPRVAGAWLDTVRESVALAKRPCIPVLNMHLSRGVYFTMPDKNVFLFDAYRTEYLKSMAVFREKCAEAVGNANVKICVDRIAQKTPTRTKQKCSHSLGNQNYFRSAPICRLDAPHPVRPAPGGPRGRHCRFASTTGPAVSLRATAPVGASDPHTKIDAEVWLSGRQYGRPSGLCHGRKTKIPP